MAETKNSANAVFRAGTSFETGIEGKRGAKQLMNPEKGSSPVERPLSYGKLVLVIDDEEDILLITKMMLQKHGIEAITANGGTEGVDLFSRRSEEINLVLIDFSMPPMGGDQVARLMHRINPSLPIILSSGLGEEEIEEYAGA